MATQHALAIVLVGLLLVGGAAALSGSLTEGGQQLDVENESWQPSTTFESLEHSNIQDARYDERVVVVNKSGNLMAPNVDYVWNDENGTVRAVSGGRLVGDNSAKIDYGYSVPTAKQKNVAEVGASGLEASRFALLFIVVGLLFVGFVVWGRI